MFRARFLGLALALVTLVSYLPVRQHTFINYDDPDYLTENPVVQAGLTFSGVQWAFTTFHASNWHPLTWLSHMVDCELFGLEPGAHHLVNVLVHTANAVLLFLVLLRLTSNPWASFFTAALFAWHPLHVQSVAWASERKDVLSTLFGLSAIWAYAKSVGVAIPEAEKSPKPGESPKGEVRRPKCESAWQRYRILSVAFFAFSLLAKPMLVTLPFLLLLLDYWPLGRGRLDRKEGNSTWLRLIAEKWPYFVLTAASCVVTYLAQKTEAVVSLEPHPLHLRLGNAVLSYGRYLLQMVWPVNLSVIYPLPRELNWAFVASSGLVLAAISWGAWKLRGSRPHLLVGWLWYLGMLVPVIGIVQVGGQAMADRYTYLPLAGIFLGLAVEGLSAVRRLRIPVLLSGACAAFVLLALLAGTRFQLGFWRDSERLFARAVVVTKDNAVAHVNLGTAYESEGRREAALKEYHTALAINPSLSQAHNNLANLLDEGGQPETALEHYREAVRLKPRAALGHANLGTLLSRLGRFDEARAEFVEAARLAPLDPRPFYLLGKAWLRKGRPAQALSSFDEALRRAPNDVQALTYAARVSAASLETQTRNGQRAVAYAERAATLTGAVQPFILDTLAMAYAEAGLFDKAREVIQRAIELSKAAGDNQAVNEMQQRLRLYESGKPYREDFAAVREKVLNKGN